MKRNKRTIKIVSIIIITLILGLTFPLCTFCAEAPAEDGVLNETDESYAKEYESVDTEIEKENAYTVIFNTLCTYSSEILSALSLIFSLLIMLCYKKGLIPVIKEALSVLNTKVKAISDKSTSFEDGIQKTASELEERLNSVNVLLEKLENTASELKNTKDGNEKMLAERKAFKTVLLTEIEMLYEIFMSATLPQYLKERVGEKISAMKALIAYEEENNEAEA